MNWLSVHWRRQRAASRWFARLQGGTPSVGIDRAFRDWLLRNPVHETEFERRELLWELTGDLRNDAAILALRQETLVRIRERDHEAARRTRRGILVAASATAAVALAVGFWTTLPRSHHQEYVTAIGEQREIVLADGSSVLLNTGTRLTVTLSRAKRELELSQGEAIFRVQHDAARPFYVKAGGATTRAIGTQFNIMYLNRQVEVTVLEGRVSVSAAGRASASQSATLDIGQSTVFRESTGLAPVAEGDLARITAWQKRRVEFDNVPLAQAVDDFNRYSDTQIVIGTASLGQIRISGGFRCGDVEDFANALTHTFGIKVTRNGGRIVLLPAS